MENTKKYKDIIICVLSALCCSMVLCIIFTKKTSQNEDMGHSETIKVDSIVRTETIYVKVPVEKIKYRDRKIVDTLYLPTPKDTTPLPFEQKHYEDSVADIYISGYKPSIDSIEYHIPKQTIYVDKVVEVPQTKKWWEDRFIFSAGVYTGYSPIYNNFDVVVGFGCGIRLGR